MTKADLIERLISRTGIARSIAMTAVDTLVTILASTLASGESIYLRGLGTFRVLHVKEKTVRNIAKGEPVTVPSHRRVKLIISKKIKNALK